MEKLTLAFRPAPTTTEICLGAIKNSLPNLCKKWGSRGAILADETVGKKFGKGVKDLLNKNGLSFDLLLFPEGEAFKTRETAQNLQNELLKRGFGRDTVLIALGGGVATDLVGYVASTFRRGIPLISIPTSLLAMVDSAIGGKTGVDTPFGKNQIGTFFPAKAILIDFDFLKTLPDKEWQNGLGEILKYGLIADRSLWHSCEEAGSAWREKKHLEKLIRASIETKIKIVEKDPEERKGLRRVVNFGHTVGHALEQLSGYEIPHGKAVAIGCLAESYISHHLGFLSAKTLEKIVKGYRRFGISPEWPGYEVKYLIEAMAMDSKAKHKTIRSVLIDRIGHCLPFKGEYCRAIERKEIEAMVHWMEK